ncbi:MAG: Sapep family Mn(2+)-dependent dipeptidase [Christensenellaceae bacterium]
MNDFNSLLSDLKNLLSIESVKTEKEPSAPFGRGVADALIYSLNLAKSFGFETKNYDNYIGEVLFGSGEDFAVLCHLDVVPAGDISKWKYPPFSATVENRTIYARGAIDDKGPFIATLYALKALKDEGFVPKKRIHLILGCDEESGWGCIEHYKKYASLPEIGFSPDASFPVIYAEKGIFQADFLFDYDKDKLFDISGGIAPNVVCDSAWASCLYDQKLAKKFALEYKDGKIFSYGKSAHASQPETGINAITALLLYLDASSAVDKRLAGYFVRDELGLKAINDETGSLTFSPDMIRIENGKINLTVDIRYPATLDMSVILDKFDGLSFVELHHQKPIYNDKESKLISTLNSVYSRHKGVKSQPVAIGGGTYARAIPLGAGFGPEDVGEEMLCHQPNEYITFEKLKFLFEVYKSAIYELCG